jgi:hypothetical protein
MKALFKGILIFWLAQAGLQLVLSLKALESLKSSMRAIQAQPVETAPTHPERKLFLITQSSIDNTNYEMRTKCMFFN